MPRKAHQISNEFPYHITARCINQEWFQIPLQDVWQVMSDYLFFIHHAFNIKIHAFILMSNHFHLIANAPEQNLSQAMNYFMRETSREITRQAGRINQTYGSPYHKSAITNDIHYKHAYKYLYRNSVEAGLSNKVESYRFSTLHKILGSEHTVIPIENDWLFFEDLGPTKALEWLNTHYKGHSKNLIRKALRKETFKFAVNPKNGNACHLEDQLS